MFENVINFDKGTNKASVYFTKESILPGFDSGCKECSLGVGSCIGPAGPDNWKDIKLIVVSEHAGHYEEEFMFPQVPNSFVFSQKDYKKKADKLPTTMNGGELIRRAVECLFNISHQDQVYYTNAIKANPRKNTNISKTKHVNRCANWWLSGEFYLLDKYCPTAPVIVCGNKALQAIDFLYPEVKQSVDSWDLKHTRRRKDLRIGLNNRPIAVTFNPAMPAKGQSRIESSLRTNRITGAIEVRTVKEWQPILIGSPLWHFAKDIQWLKSFID